MKRYKAAVLGATGAVGQKFIQLLDGHPWFKLSEVVAGRQHAGRAYGETVEWFEQGPVPKGAAGLELKSTFKDLDADVCFSALPGGQAGPIERRLAKDGQAVFTNARDLRMEPDVPLVIGEVNPDHLDLVARRPKGEGFVVANGNCTAIILSLALKPLQDAFGLDQVSVVSMQALSGGGHPGPIEERMSDNLIPFIADEEDKVETEPSKILGRLRDGRVEPASFSTMATCTRVPVLDGHTQAVSVRFKKGATAERMVRALREFRGEPQRRRLPSAPKRPIHVRDEPDRPQPRLDRDAEKGMSVSVGRMRADHGTGWRFVVLGHNRIRGAAGGSVLNAELAADRRFI